MDQHPKNLPNSPELQDAIRQFASCTTAELEILAQRLNEGTETLFGKNEIVTAVAVLLKARRAYGAQLN